jgi:non-ribosomal peptide synthetase component E (peptide arylation enzyme)
MWVFEFMGYAVYRLAMGSYLVTGPGCFRGYYAASENEARQIINVITAGHCVEE